MHAFEIKLFPASEVYEADTDFLHERLGVAGLPLKTEDFEDAELEEWLQTDVKSAGEVTERQVWAGRLASAFCESANFEIKLPKIRLFGIGLSDNDGETERISINGTPPIQLSKLPGYAGNEVGRAFYVLIFAEPHDPDIHSIAFDRCVTVHFDHLLLSQEQKVEVPAKPLPRLVLTLVDGTRLVATTDEAFIRVSVDGRKVDLPLERISSMHLQPGTNSATGLLKNGAKITCQLEFSDLELNSILGKVSVPRNKIKQLKVTPRGEFVLQMDRRSDRQEAPFHAHEPVHDGKPLRHWLGMAGPQFRAGKAADALMIGADEESAAQKQAKLAIRKIGPAAIPFLLEMLLRGVVDGHRAAQGFEVLGDLGKEALPDLLLLLDEPDDILRYFAIRSIGHIGPNAKGAVPILLEELTLSTQPHVAAEALGNIGPPAAEAVPLILEKLAKGDYPYDDPFIIALGKFGTEKAVTQLVAIAQGTDGRRRPDERGFGSYIRKHRAVEAIGALGPKSGKAVPVLIQLLERETFGNSQVPYLREKIILALGAIGPQAQEAAPLLREIAGREGRTSKIDQRMAQVAASALEKIGRKAR